VTALLLFLSSALAAPAPAIDPMELDGFDASGDTAEVSGPWFEQLGDPQLAQVVRDGIASSPQVGRSYATLKAARAGEMASFAPLLPRASFDVTTTGQPIDLVAFCAAGRPDFTQPPGGDWCFSGSARLNASWQIDVFGRNTTSFLASRYDAEAADGDLAAQELSVGAAIAGAYLDHQAARQQLLLLETQLQAQQDLLAIVELRYEQAGSTALDVLQQRSATAATEALLPPARVSVQATAQQLAVLVGADPNKPPSVAEALPEPGPPPDPGTPEALIDRRPDTVAARKRWDAQKLRVTSSTLALLPTLQAQAGTGWNYAYSDSFDSLAGWSVGGTASVPLFNGGQTHAGIRSAKAQRDQAIHAWNQAVLTAVSDVRTAALRDRENRLRREAVEAQLEASRQAYDESRERYLAGLDTFVTVLTAWNSLQQAEIGALQAHRDVLSARIALFTALGGTGDTP